MWRIDRCFFQHQSYSRSQPGPRQAAVSFLLGHCLLNPRPSSRCSLCSPSKVRFRIIRCFSQRVRCFRGYSGRAVFQVQSPPSSMVVVLRQLVTQCVFLLT